MAKVTGVIFFLRLRVRGDIFEWKHRDSPARAGLFALGVGELNRIGRCAVRDLDRRGPDDRGRLAEAFGSFLAVVIAAGNLQGGFAGRGDQRQNDVEIGRGLVGLLCLAKRDRIDQAGVGDFFDDVAQRR